MHNYPQVTFFILPVLWHHLSYYPLRNSPEQVESLWVKIKDWTNKGHLVVGVYYRSPNQGEPVDEASLLQLQEMCSQALILLVDVNYPCVSWEIHVSGSKQSRRLLESTENKFLVRV